MSYLESFKVLFEDPPIDKGVQEKHNNLIKGFMQGSLSLNKLREQLEKLDNSNNVFVLPYPGPLYGLLRKFGFNVEPAKKITYEERDHYLKAKQHGLKTKIVIEVVKERPTNLRRVQVFLSYEIPTNVSEDRFKEIIREISLAPDNPSPDDLEKLSD